MSNVEHTVVASISLKDIPCIYNTNRNGNLCVQDIVAYVRGKIERNPWVSVVIETKDTPVSVAELESYRIYWAGVNDEKADIVVGLSTDVYTVFFSSEMQPDEEDFGLGFAMSNFQSEYFVNQYQILVVPDEDPEESADKLTAFYRYILDTGRSDVLFPWEVIRKNQQSSSGLDIAPFAHRVELLRLKNSLDVNTFTAIMDELKSKIDPSNTIVQDLDGRRTGDVKLLTTYLILKYNLPPFYVSAFISDYTTYKCIYPRESLSLYERLTFLRNIPSVVGYIAQKQEFNCIAQVMKKIYPYPHAVFNMTSKRIVDNPETFNLGDPDTILLDYRAMFPGSQTPILPMPRGGFSRTALVSNDKNDVDADRKLSALFAELGALDGNIHGMSIKNTVLVKRGQDTFIVYCPEYCGIRLVLISEYLGTFIHDIDETEFDHLVDAQFEVALLQRDRQSSAVAKSQALAVAWKKYDARAALKPACPLDVWLYMRMMPFHTNGLSYFDKYLRCAPNVLPVTITEEKGGTDVSPIFRYFSEYSLRASDTGEYAVNSFGTLVNYSERKSTLRVTYEAFKSEGLL